MNFLVCKYPISDEPMKLPNLIWSSLIGRAKSQGNFPDWKRQISFEFLCLEVRSFIRISLLGSSQFHMNMWNSLIGRAKFLYEFPCLLVPNFRWTNKTANLIWSSLIRRAKFHLKFPWISLIGPAKFYMDFPDWKYPIPYEDLNFPGWKWQISNEFPWLEVPNFIWTLEIPWLKWQISYEIPWLEVSDFILTFEIPWLEVPNFIWNSLIESTQFHMKLIVWKYPVLYE